MKALIYWIRDLLGLVVKPVVNISAPPPDPQPVKEEGGLKSAVGMDYKKLRDLLAAGKWKEADAETARVMLAVAKREKAAWLGYDDIDNFPCADLRTIDQLWVKYSKGKFGFSVQKRIYQGLGGTREYNQEIWKKFQDKIGWRGKLYNHITFDKCWSKKGQLPVWLVYGEVLGEMIYRRDIQFNFFWYVSFLSRRDL